MKAGDKQRQVTEATCSSKTLVGLQWTKWHYTPEDKTVLFSIFSPSVSSIISV
jgi:hypothetical protein